MSFKDWLFSNYPPNSGIEGQWGALHIIVLITCILLIVAISILLSKKRVQDDKYRRLVILVLASLILFFEISRRIINLIKTDTHTLNSLLTTLLPRPWCAISCWMVIIAVFVNKKFFYNFASITSILCGLIFFAYPGAGFNHKYILFENLYSIATHSLFFITAILFITLKFTDFKFKGMWKELICLGGVYVYGAIETWILRIEGDPLYYLPNNEIMEIFGMEYLPFLIGYILFIAVFCLSFYLIQNRKTLFKRCYKN